MTGILCLSFSSLQAQKVRGTIFGKSWTYYSSMAKVEAVMDVKELKSMDQLIKGMFGLHPHDKQYHVVYLFGEHVPKPCDSVQVSTPIVAFPIRAEKGYRTTTLYLYNVEDPNSDILGGKITRANSFCEIIVTSVGGSVSGTINWDEQDDDLASSVALKGTFSARLCNGSATGEVEEEEVAGGCEPYVDIKQEPGMIGGLMMSGREIDRTVRRDGFIQLTAKAQDFDTMEFGCRTQGDCAERGEAKKRGLASPTSINWKIISGGGEFVQVGCLPGRKTTAKGENVIYRPPVDLPFRVDHRVHIQMTIEDVGQHHAVDRALLKDVYMSLRRGDGGSDHYTVTIGGDFFPREELTFPENEKQISGNCTVAYSDDPGEELAGKPTLIIPTVKDATSLAEGEMIALAVEEIKDTDVIELRCASQSCNTGEKKAITVDDKVEYRWMITSGEGALGFNTLAKETFGRQIVFTAIEPGPVELTVYAFNPQEGNLQDRISEVTRVKLQVYEKGIELRKMNASWLPEYKTVVGVKAQLKVKKGGKWVQGFRHMSALMDFELQEVSNLMGICSNFDEERSPEGRKSDVFFNKLDNEGNYELYEGEKHPGDKERFHYARLVHPITGGRGSGPSVQVMDYGAYARVVLKEIDEREWKKIGTWSINIPLDENDNHIADAAPHDVVGNRLGDDGDGLPIGDGTEGDGLTAFEEYRGFMDCEDSECALTQHTRTEIGTKDLFVWCQTPVDLGLFQRASGITAHYVDGRYLKDRIINHKSISYKGGDQYGVIIKKGVPTIKDNVPIIGGWDWAVRDALGKAQVVNGVADAPNIPKYIKEVVLNLDSIMRQGYFLDEVVAHELAHACNVQHHGDADVQGSKCVFNPGSNSCKSMAIVPSGTKYSGVMTCIMKYDVAGFSVAQARNMQISLCTSGWNLSCDHNDAQGSETMMVSAFVQDYNTGWQDGSAVRARNMFCSHDGGANAPYGRAAPGRGNCASQFRVKCW